MASDVVRGSLTDRQRAVLRVLPEAWRLGGRWINVRHVAVKAGLSVAQTRAALRALVARRLVTTEMHYAITARGQHAS